MSRKCQACTVFPEPQVIELKTPDGSRESRERRVFAFDEVFDPEQSQEMVYTHVGPLVQSALDGFNVCIFAYGQTGSGKTFTMAGVRGNPELEGVTPRYCSST
jgi:hypothetical protein